VLRDLCGLKVKESELIEIEPQETASLRRSDFVLRALFEDNKERLVLLEFITAWKKYLPLRTLETRCRHQLQEELEIITVMIELRRCGGVKDYYRDNEVEFRYKVIKLYELKAEEILRKGLRCLYPFLPLMEGGKDFIDEAERGIYEGEGSRAYKSDLLTGMAIFGGLVSEEIPMKLIQRRRDIMIESVAYEIIKKEGYSEGIQQGIQQGLLLDAQEMLLDALEERFEIVPNSIAKKIKQIDSREVVKSLFRIAMRTDSLEEFESKLKIAMN
jgi:hypothetical protein